MLPCSFTPLTRKIVTADLLLRTAFRNVSCRFCCFSLMAEHFFIMVHCPSPPGANLSIGPFAAFAKGLGRIIPVFWRAIRSVGGKVPADGGLPVRAFRCRRGVHQ